MIALMKHKRLMFNVLERKVLGRESKATDRIDRSDDRWKAFALYLWLAGELAQDPQEVEMIDLRWMTFVGGKLQQPKIVS